MEACELMSAAALRVVEGATKVAGRRGLEQGKEARRRAERLSEGVDEDSRPGPQARWGFRWAWG